MPIFSTKKLQEESDMTELAQRNQGLNAGKEDFESLAVSVISMAVREEGTGYLETEDGRWWLGTLGMDGEVFLGYVRRLECVAS